MTGEGLSMTDKAKAFMGYPLVNAGRCELFLSRIA
jgi:hypothetical protein